ncbi:MAG: alpha/beta hydrolase [Gaiellaceae bacterium]
MGDSRLRTRLLTAATPFFIGVSLLIGGAAASATPGPGRVEVNGHMLNLVCTGSGSPTIVFESGLGDSGDVWTMTIGRLGSVHARKCRYDRYGLGLSDVPTSTITRTVEQVAAEKHDLLAAAGINGPYILVSHSIAGLIDRYFAKVYPSQVAGAVMVDTAPDDWNVFTHTDLFSETAAAKLAVAPASQALRASDRLGKSPLVVIESEYTQVVSSKSYWHKRQRALAKISSNSIFLVAKGSDHNVPYAAPKLIAKTIGLVVSSARKHKHLPKCKAAKLAGARC